MQIASSSALAASAAPGPQSSGASSATPGADSPFAKMLSAQQAPARADAQRPAARETADPSHGEDATREAEDSSSSRPAPRRSAGRSSSRAEPARTARGETADAQALGLPELKLDGAAPRDTQADEAAADGTNESDVADPALADRLAGVSRPLVPPLASAASGGVPAEATSAVDAVPAQGPRLPAALSALRGAADARAHQADQADDAASRRPAGDVAAEHVAGAGTHDMLLAASGKPQVEPRTESTRGFELPSPTAAAGVQGAPRNEAGATGATSIANLATPATSPEFREALGVQVSVLARDGVQRAELHLNPAEMGPISVQIALDGARAQVDFGAESLATRQIIEAGLPELATALRDAGFTLAGGGVSQHARGQSDGDGGHGGDPGARHHADEADAPAARRVTTRVSQGAVDVYA